MASKADLTERFRGWLEELSDAQLAALDENWDNVMNDATWDRIDSWIIAEATIAELRRESSDRPPPA